MMVTLWWELLWYCYCYDIDTVILCSIDMMNWLFGIVLLNDWWWWPIVYCVDWPEVFWLLWWNGWCYCYWSIDDAVDIDCGIPCCYCYDDWNDMILVIYSDTLLIPLVWLLILVTGSMTFCLLMIHCCGIVFSIDLMCIVIGDVIHLVIHCWLMMILMMTLMMIPLLILMICYCDDDRWYLLLLILMCYRYVVIWYHWRYRYDGIDRWWLLLLLMLLCTSVLLMVPWWCRWRCWWYCWWPVVMMMVLIWHVVEATLIGIPIN